MTHTLDHYQKCEKIERIHSALVKANNTNLGLLKLSSDLTAELAECRRFMAEWDALPQMIRMITAGGTKNYVLYVTKGLLGTTVGYWDHRFVPRMSVSSESLADVVRALAGWLERNKGNIEVVK